MMKSAPKRPPLEASLRTLKLRLRPDVVLQSPAHAAELYLSAMHLLGELKQDQVLLYEWRRNHKSQEESCPCPPPEQIPAITAVIQDAVLFRALVRCLQTACSDSSVVPDAAATTGINNHNPLERKRSLSMTGDTPMMMTSSSSNTTTSSSSSSSAMKSAKLSHHHHPAPHHLSPVPMSRGKVVNLQQQRRSPVFDVRAFAAICLYSAFQHLDHWPVPLVQAYAQDCFGPRCWVELVQCAVLVENLALVHRTSVTPTTSNSDNDARVEKDAELVANAYSKFDAGGADCSSDMDVSPAGQDDSNGVGKSDDAAASGGRRPHSSVSSGSLESLDATSTAQNGVNHQKRHGGKYGSGGDDDKNPDVIKQSASDLSTSKQGDGDSSSSGEEDEDAVVMTKSVDSSGKKTSSDGNRGAKTGDTKSDALSTTAVALYPVLQTNLDLSRIRQRFFGRNLEAAHGAIVATLVDRVDVKSKQNSTLLQCLPSFTSIPGVRCQVAANLEKWLQSPALAGLARTLFSSTVNNLKNIDPPLDEDLQAIDSIIAMRLKANQLNAHIENVTAIARRIPVASVASHLYSKLLRDLYVQSDASVGSAATDHLKMIGAIHREILPHISYDSIAVGLLTLLANPPAAESCGAKSPGTPVKCHSDRARLVKKLRRTIRSLSTELGSTFDGCLLINALLSLDVRTASWSAGDEEDKARLMFQCVTMSVSPFLEAFEGSKLSDDDAAALRKSLASSRKLILTWCCMEYGPHFGSKRKRKRPESECGENLAGAGVPDFDSALGTGASAKRIPPWLIAMRCLLLLEDADSPLMKRFLFPGDAFNDDIEAEWELERRRLRVCCRFGRDVYDELLWIVLRSASMSQGIDPEMSIQLLEHMFRGCSLQSSGSLTVSDPNLVWEMYNIVLFTPQAPASLVGSDSDDSEKEDPGKNTQGIPRLAYPGLWWRVTMLALAMCGHSPSKLGAVMWEEHPTLRALITMVTSNRFRFPTVDCDEDARAEVKRLEQAARESETSMAEFLFLPPIKDKKKKEQTGSRMSRRLLKQQEEKESARELAEKIRRMDLLRAAQKTIMLWDPDGPARKPPRESVDLLLSVEELFELSVVFQRSVDPDFLLMTIGKTTRGAIERAYEWLIPIISTFPDTIARLPSSASCFLLLRAYGTEGDERKQLKALSSPLLQHVKDSLNGKYGETDAVKAFDLLMSDVASSKPDRRRCARRVLQDALAQSKENGSSPQSWMLNVLQLDCAKALAGDAVKHMSTAAAFEQGGVLRSLVVALEKHIVFSEQNEVQVDLPFAELLVRLISNRPSIFAAAMDSYSDMRSLSVRVLYSNFAEKAKKRPEEMVDSTDSPAVVMKLFKTLQHEGGTVHLPLNLLQSICVVLSIWKERDAQEDDAVKTAVNDFVGALLRPDEDHNDEGCGLASARMRDDGVVEAVPVESWIMLAKSRSDALAKRAALSAPSGFLPRLLLCSGLPRASLLAMLDRLGRLGDAANDAGDLYCTLMAPSVLSEWDIGRVGHHRERARKLLGRLSAYLRLHQVSLNGTDSDISTTFLAWLSKECQSNSNIAATSKQKNSKSATGGALSGLVSASSLLSTLQNDIYLKAKTLDTTAAHVDLDDFKKPKRASEQAPNDGQDVRCALSTIADCVKNDRFIVLDEWLKRFTAKAERNLFESKSDTTIDLVDLSLELLKCFYELKNPPRGAVKTLLKWFPRLSSAAGKPDLWKLFFRSTADSAQTRTSRQLMSKCMLFWSIQHITQCMEWVVVTLDHANSVDCDYEGVALFLILCSKQPSAQIELFSEFTCEDSGWARSKEFVSSGTLVAIRSLEQSPDRVARALLHRNNLPTGCKLVFLLARCGKKQLRTACEAILRELSVSDTESTTHTALRVLFLRLYLNFPYWMDLGSATARTTLMRCAETFGSSWVDWKSSFDDRIDDLLHVLCSGELKSTKQLSEISRKQPLLVLRKLPMISKILSEDATIDSTDSANQRGAITGQNLAGKRDVKLHGKTVKMDVRHWGYTYTEPLWASLLDVLSSMPREVLFTCGVKVGLLDVLTVYVQLVSVQIQLLSASKSERLKTKLNVAFTTFKQCNPDGWTEWLVSRTGENQVRHQLMSCAFISPQEAMECAKK